MSDQPQSQRFSFAQLSALYACADFILDGEASDDTPLPPPTGSGLSDALATTRRLRKAARATIEKKS
jgi:hypothetical protein